MTFLHSDYFMAKFYVAQWLSKWKQKERRKIKRNEKLNSYVLDEIETIKREYNFFGSFSSSSSSLFK